MISEIINKIKAGIGKALIDAVNDDGAIQLVKIQLMENEIQDGVERIQNYGMTSNPPAGSECVPVFVGGSRDHGVAVAVDCGAWRVTGLASGEVCIYSKFGQKILLKSNGEILFTTTDKESTDYAVLFSELKKGFDKLVSDFNSHTHSGSTANIGTGACSILAPSATVPVPSPSTASINACKIDSIRMPIAPVVP